MISHTSRRNFSYAIHTRKKQNPKHSFPESLDLIIEQDNEVRIIDLFVESIHLTDFKFVIKTSKEGRPAYHPKDLLKLFLVLLSQSYPFQPPVRERMQTQALNCCG